MVFLFASVVFFFLLWHRLDSSKSSLFYAKKIFNYLVEGFCVKRCFVWYEFYPLGACVDAGMKMIQ